MPWEKSKGSFIRWQSTTIAQLTYSVNLILGLAVAALGFQVTLLLNEKFVPMGWQKCVFGISMLALLLSIALGIWCVINRLRDFRATTKAASLREYGRTEDEIRPYRDLYTKLGETTWALFCWQIGTFGVGILFAVLQLLGGTSMMSLEWWALVGQVVQTVVVVLLAPVAVLQLFLQRKATRDQANATLHQTIATIISWVQAHDIRESRRQLFEWEDKKAISQIPIDQWQEDWKQAVDRVSQAFNSAAIVAKQDRRLQEVWIKPTRRAILRSWKIAEPRLRERRKQIHDLWEEFEWLAKKAKEYRKSGDEAACDGSVEGSRRTA